MTYRPRAARVIDEVHATTTVVNNAADTNLSSLTLPAGIVAAGDHLRIGCAGDFLNNTAGSATVVFKFKIGSTTALTTNAIGISNNANRRKWYFEFDVYFAATNAERVGGSTLITNPNSPEWIWGTNTLSAAAYGTAAEDSASSLALVLVVNLGAADANLDCRLHAASLEHLPKM